MKKIIYFISLVVLTSCVSIPKETVVLSRTLGNDIKVLHASHRNMVNIYYFKIKDEINSFVDDVYAPFIIHYVLKKELANYKGGKHSLYGVIELAGQKEGKEESEQALKEMMDFQKAAYAQIEKKRSELLSPIIIQEYNLLNTIDQSYENAVFANSTITAYLESVRKVKESQQEALSIIGLEGADTLITQNLVSFSQQINELVDKGKEIDVESDNAYNKIEEISNKIIALTKNK